MASTDKSSKAKKAGKAPRDRQVATAKTWQRSGAEDLELPSGNIARVRRPGPTKLLTAGIMPDSLMPIIQQSIRDGKGLPPEAEKDLLNDLESLSDVMDGMDRAMTVIVIEPKVLYHKRETDRVGENGKKVWEEIPDDERDTETYIYTDEVDTDDKMFLFNYAVGGTRDLERFREESATRVGDVAGNAEPGDSSE